MLGVLGASEGKDNSEGKDTRASDELLLSGALVYISGWLAHLVPLLHRLGAAPADVRIGPLCERLFGGLGLARGDFEEGWWQGMSLSSLVFCIAIQPEVEAHSARQLVVMRSGTLRHAMSGSIPIIAVCVHSPRAHVCGHRSLIVLRCPCIPQDISCSVIPHTSQRPFSRVVEV